MTSASRSPRAGRVIANHGSTLLVAAGDAAPQSCVARKSAGTVICGDRVDWLPGAQGHGVIIRVHPRTSLLSRPDSRGKPRQLCANINRVLVTGALGPEPGAAETGAAFRQEMIDSYLAAAELLGIDAAIILNKIDLAGPATRIKLEQAHSIYRGAGYRLVETSARHGEGLDELRLLTRGCSSVLVGESGVGKSSLIAALVPDSEVRIGELSAGGGKGRHTTTVATLFALPGGGDIIDSPGVREFRLWPVSAADLAWAFREFRDHIGHCRYRDCRHLQEPDCAITAAAREGLIAEARVASYRALFASFPDREY